MALTEVRAKLLAELLGEMEYPVPPAVFDVLCFATITVPVELAVMTDAGEILMIYRKDRFYDGWHIPGTVVLRGTTKATAVQRLLAREVGAPTSDPIFIAPVEIMMGTGEGQNPRGQEESLLYGCTLTAEYTGKGKFYPIDQIPEDTLSHHKVLVARVKKWWEKNSPK